MKVLFIGGTGLISEAVTKLALEKGIDLYLFNRGNRKEIVPEGAKVIVGDIRDMASAQAALKDYEFDVVVDWIAYTPDHVRADIELFKGRVGQYIFISSASVYQKPASHYIITESTPLSNPYWQYSRDKIACEDALMEEYRRSGFPMTIVRPSYTYGNSMIPAGLSSWGHPWSLIDRMRKGKEVIIHGDGTSLWTMTHNTDLAKGFVGLLGHVQAVGQSFHITSDEVLTWNQIYDCIAKAAGVTPNYIHIASEFIASVSPGDGAALLGDRMESFVFDNSKIKRYVPDYCATIPFTQGIRQTIQWFEADPARCTVDRAWDETMDKIVAAYRNRG